MLHTDVGLEEAAGGRPSALKESGALAYANLMEQLPALHSYVERWYMAVACEAQRRLAWPEALEWAERGLRQFPEDVTLRLVVASVEEILASLSINRMPEAAFSDPDLEAAAGRDDNRDSRKHLQRAEAFLLDVLGQHPEWIDARVRLGRVDSRLGKASEAQAAFETTLAAASSGPDAYLAHLFLGRVEEARGELAAAARSYDAAITIDPQCQSARLAASHVQFMLGDAAGARRQLGIALSHAGHRTVPDPLWLYPWGVSAGTEALLATLRAEASR